MVTSRIDTNTIPDLRVLDALSAHISVLNTKGEIIAVNEAWLKFAAENCPPDCTRIDAGMNYLTSCRISLSQSCDPEGTKALQGIEDVLNGRRKSFMMEYPCDSPTSNRWFRMEVEPLGTANPLFIIAHQDITDRRIAQEQLKRSEEKFSKAFHCAPSLMTISTIEEGRCLDLNDAFACLSGFNREVALGATATELGLIAKEDRRKILEILEEEGKVRDLELQATRANGSKLICRYSAVIIEVEGQKRLLSIASDITDRKKVEETLRSSQARYRKLYEESMQREKLYESLLHSVPDAVVIYDSEGKATYVNPAFTEVFGFTLQDVVGSTIPFVPESEKEKTAAGIQKVLEGQPVTGFETKRLTKDGRTLDIVLSSSCYDDHKGHRAGIVVFLRDVTRTKETERKFHKAQKMEAIGTLAGGVAHDFNNLLTGIQGHASLLSFEMEPSHPLLEHVDAIMDHAKSAADLTKQLLGIAREGKYEAKPISLNEVVQQSASMFGRTKKEIRIHYKFQDPSPVAIADLRQIEQVLLNLYINAWQTMPEGGDLYLETSAIELGDTYCQSYAACGGRYAKIAVTDTGFGMDSATCERVFDPFFTTKKKSRGTGLGLASAYGIVKNHNGIITVESQMGVGTTFNVYLPFSHQPVPKEMSVDAELRKGSGTILLVDDEKLVLDVGKAILEKLGYHVLVADNGVQAIETVRQGLQKPDLVILDMIMPGLAGGKTFESIREIGPEIPVLLSSGYSRNRQAEEIIRKGAHGFIQKPFQVAELSQIVQAVIADVKQANS